ncbi:BTAD domain-containing putative transcriptional regulator [Kribbella sp. DT2]|uniref:AfsR/SARP family transcriptional regulator n=1 Tax=Kribbella sp. DT2 TaxID=3393427 RepID=UPI003CF14215
MEFRLLGPVQIWAEGHQVELKRRQERLLLAVLLLESGKAVPADRLIELLWPEEQPGNPKRALQVYVSRLRSVLATGDSRLVNGSHGYAIEGAGGRTDVELFAALVEQAKPLDDLEQRRKLLTDALALWRGPALADVASETVRRRLCVGLDESRWAAQELRLTTELALGRHRELLPELAELTAEQPTRESLAEAQMLALYRSGRQTDALAAYAELVRHLSDELGVEPGPQLRDLQVAILRQDESLDFRAAEPGPRELPADIGVLVGRDAVLAELTALIRRTPVPALAAALRSSGAQRPTRPLPSTGALPPIEALTGALHPTEAPAALPPTRQPASLPTVISLYGAAGTGKSATAVRLGHALAAEFPDGQLFARLQDVNGEPVPPGVLLGRLLRSLGVDNLPESVEERSALLRSTLAGKAVLLVLDDAADAAQLRPLLPADSRCAVVVTSRRPLLGLEDAIHREISPLDHATSADLLAALSGRPADELQEIVGYCVGLPLALRIVGARLSLIREDVAEVVKSLADESSRLDYLVAGDRAVRASLDLTLRTAGETARRLFGCLALVGADEFSAWVAAPLLDLDERAARAVLVELVALGLVQPRRTSPSTYGLHALVRARAVEELDTYPDRETVETRYLQAVLRLLAIADEEIGPMVTRRMEFDAGEGRPLEDTDRAAAAGADWLEIEAPVMAAAVGLASSRPRLAAMLAMRLDDFLMVRDLRELREEVLAVADAATSATDPEIESEVLQRRFGAVAQGNAPLEVTREIGRRALAAAERTGNPERQAAALAQVAYAATEAADYEGAIEAADRILALSDRCADPAAAQARALDQLSVGLRATGRTSEALDVRRRLRAVSPAGTRIHAIRLVLFAQDLSSGPGQGAEHLAELEEIVAEAGEIVGRIGDDLGRAHVDVVEARALVLRGDFTAAAKLLDQAAEVFAARPDPWGEVQLCMGRAWLAVRSGHGDEGLGVLAAGIDAMAAIGYQPGVIELGRQVELARTVDAHSA